MKTPALALRLAPSLLLCAALGACQALPQASKVDFVEPLQSGGVAKLMATAPQQTNAAVPVGAPRAASGSLFHTSTYRPAFEDARARFVGDSVTINITEAISASQKSSSSLGRSSEAKAGISALPLMNKGVLGKLGVGGNSGTNFEGKGDTVASNSFTGVITTNVIEVLPNGHLVVAGEKQVGVNQNVDVLRFSGTVNPADLQLGSVIPSNKVANARIQSRGRGATDEAQAIGWLSRFFLNVTPF